MSGDQLRRLKEREKENERVRRAVSDLTLDKQILAEAAGDGTLRLHVQRSSHGGRQSVPATQGVERTRLGYCQSTPSHA